MRLFIISFYIDFPHYMMHGCDQLVSLTNQKSPPNVLATFFSIFLFLYYAFMWRAKKLMH